MVREFVFPWTRSTPTLLVRVIVGKKHTSCGYTVLLTFCLPFVKTKSIFDLLQIALQPTEDLAKEDTAISLYPPR